MPGPRRFASFGPAHLLLLLAVVELGVTRIAVPGLVVSVPAGHVAPSLPLWHAALDWFGVFLHYFVGTLSVALLIVRATRAGMGEGGVRIREIAIAATIAVIGAVAALELVVGSDKVTGFTLETALAAAMVTALAVSLRAGAWQAIRHPMTIPRDRVALGAMIGLAFVAVPFLIHYYGVITGLVRPDEGDVPAATNPIIRAGVSAVALAAIASPYCFGPRPFSRAVTRIVPVVVAMVVAGTCAILARRYYMEIVPMVKRGIGVPLSTDGIDQSVGLYILATATLVWTLVSCAISDAEPRRRIGLGLGLIVLGGYHAVVWPAYYAMIGVGLVTIVDAIPALPAAEWGERVIAATPAIEDRIWQTWVTALVGGLRALGHQVHALTSRGEDELMSTVVSGEIAGRPFRMRIERVAGSVLAIDSRFGRDLGDQQVATFTVQARPEEALRGIHPEPPLAAPRVELDDLAFESRFRSRGSKPELLAALDDGVRARLTATMDGWLAVWKGESVRHRVYPGRGAPIDQPVPLADLALRRAGPEAADRLITLIGVLADVARRTLPESAASAPVVDADDLPPVEDAS